MSRPPLSGGIAWLAAVILASSAGLSSARIIDGSRIVARELPNGVRVIVKPEHEVPVVALCAVVRGGSSVEGESERGLAHVLEHMVFQTPEEGSPTGLLPRTIEALGGEVLAETTRDFWLYRVTVAPDGFGEAAAALALALSEPVIDPERLRKELQIMDQELEEAYADPLEALREAAFDAFYRGGPYGASPGGGPGGLRSFSADEVSAFRAKHYIGPNTAVLVIGDVEPEPAIATIASNFGALPGGTSTFPAHRPVPVFDGAELELTLPGAGQEVVALAWPAPGIDRPADVLATDVLLCALDHGRKSRLHLPLAQELPGIGPSGAGFLTQRLPGVMLIWVATGRVGAEAVLDQLKRMLTDIASGGVTDEECMRAARGARLLHAGGGETYTGQARILGFYEGIGSYLFGVEYEDEVLRVTPSDLAELVRRYYDPARALVLRGRPAGDAE